MTPERWRQLTEVFHAALAREIDDRAEFVAAQCAGDVALRHDVDAMLAAHHAPGAFSGPASLSAAALAPGARLGPYEIVCLLGAGGMGEVYRARDTNLHREVALKVLLASVANDPDRLARLAGEARTLAALNHRNIAQVHGLEEGVSGSGQAGIRGLVMELVEGLTLADRIAWGPLPMDEALEIARQIAEALEAAHEHGIVHRDLKPANIKVRPDGTVKVLDFGLAKTLNRRLEPADTSAAPRGVGITEPGAILGTAAYMAPEQARGRPVDRRADLWAFGCVLFEMLTGRRAFDDETPPAIRLKILDQEPDWEALPKTTPAAIRTLLRRCLEKDPRRRLDSAAAARLEIDDALTGAIAVGFAAADVPVTPSSSMLTDTWPRPIAPLALAMILGGLIAGGTTWYAARPAPAPARAERFVLAPSDAPPLTNSNSPSVWMSPDGSSIIYRSGLPVSRTALWALERGTLQPASIPGTEDAIDPFFSPDGKSMAFFTNDGVLKRMPSLGGPTQIICKVDDTSRGGSWGSDDQIVFATVNSKGLMRVPAAGGEPQVLTKVDRSTGETDHFWPETLPGGQGVLFTAWNGTPERSRIAVVSASDGRVLPVVAGGTYPRFAASGHLLFALAGTLRAVRFDPARLAVAGESTSVVDDLAMTPAGGAHYAIGRDGSMAYASGSDRLDDRTLVWVDRQGRQEDLNLPPRPYFHARVSPDGSRLALDIRDQENDIWIWDFGKATLQNLTVDPGRDRAPAWTPDSNYVAFSSARDGRPAGIFWRRADGSAPAERIDAGLRPQAPLSFSPDGKRLLFLTPFEGGTGQDIGVLDLGEPHREEILLDSPFKELNGNVSPDGQWLAYDSNESGTREVYVRPFPNVGRSRQLVSSGGGSRPLWSRDGRELFYWVDPGTILAVPVTLGSAFSFDKPTVVVKGRYHAPPTIFRHYDVSPDGKRFLMTKDVESTDKGKRAAPELRLVLHFFDELNRLVK